MGIAGAAISAGDMQTADYQLEAAYKLCLETQFIRSDIINLISFWGLIGITVRERGYPELADHCKNMAALLQASFNAGEYYGDP